MLRRWHSWSWFKLFVSEKTDRRYEKADIMTAQSFSAPSVFLREEKEDIRCPLEYGLQVFGGKWKSRIICVLAEKKSI